jgi:drug/metabolite transporter (DMT)-like permease
MPVAVTTLFGNLITVIVSISSIVTTSIIANIYHKNPALKESNRNTYNYIMMNLMLAILFLIFGLVNCYMAIMEPSTISFSDEEFSKAIAVYLLFVSIASITSSSIGLQLFNKQPDLIVNNPNSYNYIMINLIVGVILMLFSIYCMFKSYRLNRLKNLN